MKSHISSYLIPYQSALLALGVFGVIYLCQLLVADVVNILRKHTPGMPIVTGHGDFHFRATRAHANTTESIGSLILIAGFALAVGAEPTVVTWSIWTFVLSRFVHMCAYYFDWRWIRTAAFALSIISLFVLFGEGVRAL